MEKIHYKDLYQKYIELMPANNVQQPYDAMDCAIWQFGSMFLMHS